MTARDRTFCGRNGLNIRENKRTGITAKIGWLYCAVMVTGEKKKYGQY